MSDSIVGGLYAYLGQCPFMTGNRINVDYLPENIGQKGVEYSIDTTPSDVLVKAYTGRGGIYQYTFIIRSVKKYSEGALQGIANSGIMEQISDWVRQQNMIRNLPELPAGKTAIQVAIQSIPYLMQQNGKFGYYQMQCAVQYVQN